MTKTNKNTWGEQIQYLCVAVFGRKSWSKCWFCTVRYANKETVRKIFPMWKYAELLKSTIYIKTAKYMHLAVRAEEEEVVVRVFVSLFVHIPVRGRTWWVLYSEETWGDWVLRGGRRAADDRLCRWPAASSSLLQCSSCTTPWYDVSARSLWGSGKRSPAAFDPGYSPRKWSCYYACLVTTEVFAVQDWWREVKVLRSLQAGTLCTRSLLM